MLTIQKRKLYLCSFEFVSGISWIAIAYSVPFLRSIQLSTGEVGAIMTVLSILSAIAPSTFGTLADRLQSRKRIYIVLMIVSIVFNLAILLFKNAHIGGLMVIAILFPAMNFFRTGFLGMQDVLMVAEADDLPNGDYSKVRVWGSMGYVLGGFLVTWLMERFGFGMGMPLGLFAGLSCVLLLCTKPLKDITAVSAKKKTFAELKPMRLYGNFYVVVAILTLTIFNLSQGALLYIQDMIVAVEGDVEQLGKILGFKTFMDAGMLFLFPLLRKKFSLPVLVVAGGLLYSIEMLSYPLCTNTTQIMLIASLNGAGIGLLLGAGINYMAILAPKGLESSSIALYNAAFYSGQILTNIFASLFLDALGIRLFYTVLGTVVLATSVLFVLSFPFGRHILKKEPVVQFRIR